MGVMQAAAILPELFRACSLTIAGGLYRRRTRESGEVCVPDVLPAILGSVVFGAKDVMDNRNGRCFDSAVIIRFCGCGGERLCGYQIYVEADQQAQAVTVLRLTRL